MGFIAAIKSGFRNYFNFSGRAARAEYWWWFLFTVLCSLPFIAWSLWASWGLRVPEQGLPADALRTAAPIPYFTAMALGWATFLPSLTVGVRRMRDTGKALAIPCAALFYALTFLGYLVTVPSAVTALATLALFIFALLPSKQAGPQLPQPAEPPLASEEPSLVEASRG